MKKFKNIALASVLIISTALPAVNNTVYANTENPQSGTSETAPKKEPVSLDIVADQTTNLDSDNSAVINVTIRNNSRSVATNVTAKAIIENPDKVYIDGDGYIFQNERKISNNGDERGSFRIKADKFFESKSVPIKIQCKYYDGNDFKSTESTIYVRLIAQPKKENPAIEISKVALMWPKSIQTGQVFPATFEIRNTGDSTAKNIKVSLEGLESNNITLSDGLSTLDITKLEPGQSQYIYFNLKSQNQTKPGSYMLKLNYKFTGESTTTAPIEGNYQFSIDVVKSKDKPSTLEFSNISFPSKPVGRNRTVDISFDVTNTGKNIAKDVKVMANSQDLSGLASKSVSQINAKPIKPGEKRHFTFSFITTPSAETRNYPVDIKLIYSDKNTADEPYSISQIAGVFVQAPKESAPGEKGETSVPKLIIEEYSFDPEIIEAGKPFNMKLRLYNTSAKKAVKNIKIYLTSDVQESVSQSGDSQDQTGSSSSSASVFTPVESSNTFYIASIAPGAKVEKEIRLTTVPDTAAKTYTVIANFEYEDASATKYTANEQIGIPVVQKAKLDVGDIVPEGDFSVGMETPLSVDFFNTGKATLYNVMVKISGDGLKFDTPSYYKGNFAPGSSDNFSCNITPDSSGKKRFTLTFSFEDSTGQNQVVIRDYEFDVNDGADTENMADVNPDDGYTSPLKKIIIGVCIFIVAIIGGIIGKRIYDKKKNDHEDLDI